MIRKQQMGGPTLTSSRTMVNLVWRLPRMNSHLRSLTRKYTCAQTKVGAYQNTQKGRAVLSSWILSILTAGCFLWQLWQVHFKSDILDQCAMGLLSFCNSWVICLEQVACVSQSDKKNCDQRGFLLLMLIAYSRRNMFGMSWPFWVARLGATV